MWPRGMKAYTVESVRWLKRHGVGLREMTRPKHGEYPEKGQEFPPLLPLIALGGRGGFSRN